MFSPPCTILGVIPSSGRSKRLRSVAPVRCGRVLHSSTFLYPWRESRAKRDFRCPTVRVSVVLHGKEHLSKLHKASTLIGQDLTLLVATHRHLSRSTPAPPLHHTMSHHRVRHRQAVWGERISVNLSHASASMQEHPPRHAGSTLGMHRQARQSENPFHGSASLQVSLPHDTPPQLCAHGLTTSKRRTSSRAVYRVFWHTYELTGLGGPARLYQAIGHIGTRPFYEALGAILLKVDSFGHTKRSSRGHYVLIVTWPPDTTLGGALSCVHT